MFYRETEFKDTEIGKIPKDWGVVRLGDVALEIRTGPFGSQLRSSELTDHGIKVYTQDNVLRKDFSIGDIYISPEKFEKLKNMEVRPGDVLLTIRGTVGKAVVVPPNIERGIIHTNLALIRCHAKKLSPEYLEKIINDSEIFLRQINANRSSTTLPALYAKTIKNLKIPLPPLKEQRKIAEILSTIDKAIEKTNEIIARTERLKRGLMQELLTRGIIFGFMFDTNIFNRILDQNIPLDMLPKKLRYYVTHNQKDEIERSPDDNRKKELLRIFKAIEQEKIPTETTLWGISPWGESKWGAYGGLYDKLLKRIQKLDKEAGKKKSLENQSRDALIAETCILNNLVLVSDDENLRKVVEEFKGVAITFEQFLKGEYREFKDTEIGKIPKDWEVVRLGDEKYFKIIMGQSPPSSTYNQEKEGLPFLQGCAEFGDIYPKPQLYTNKPIKIAEEGDILISVRAPVGEINIAPFKLCIGRGLASIRPNTEKVNKFFVFYYLKIIKSKLEQLGKGSTFKAITKNDLEMLEIPLPPLEEQKKIAQILSTVDKKLEIEKKEKEKLERIKRGFMDLLLTGKVRVCL